MKTVFISILAISFLSFSVNAQPAISQEAKSLEGEVVQHKKDQRNKLAEAYKEYKATKAAAATAYKSANLQSEKDFRKAKELIAQIESGKPDDMHFDARVKVLGEYIDHHVKEEQDELFPKVKDAGMDTKTIGHELAARKAALMGDMMQKAA